MNATSTDRRVRVDSGVASTTTARPSTMAPAPTTTDAFTALAEPRRRELLTALSSGAGEHDVTWLVQSLGWSQPQVSKHLGVLRGVGLVNVAQRGRRRVYSINGPGLQPVFNWVKGFERFWEHQLERIRRRAEERARDGGSPSTAPPSDP